ncbi:Eco57I restriction-modification methylase domain-containing protein [Edaphobacter sp. DSM 109919]|uniref:site-specific DNA-methyltransferase (adenine-specific) n=1 Tax=Edaphobacter paludis TaxID=3035702 RepID=A0AAU7CTE7_9BACT
MPIDRERSRQCLKAFDFRKLFLEELGWDKFSSKLVKQIDGVEYSFHAVAEKRGVVVLVADSIPDYAVRVKLDKLIAKDHFEHLIVFSDKAQGRQVWQWVRKETGKPTAVRTYHFSSHTASGQAGELLLQKLDNLVFTLEEEESIRTGTVTGRLKAFDVEKVTKKFYERFKTEHASFLGFIKGIPDKQMESWYASVMINRLMFLYFIQEKGFLNGDPDYLRNKLAESSARKPNAYYAEFLSPLFFQGFARKKADRSAATNKLLGEIPYLNGGLFQKHQIEEVHGKTIVIVDKAFEKLFDFFKEYNWHLDEREDHNDREINPDVLGYIFEKYINQKQMGAYYTKEDITEYISQNTIIPFLLDEARKGCAVAFTPEGSVWRLLRDDPDRYIHDAMKKGASLALPSDIEAGVHDVARRSGWNKTAPEEYALPTEIWREAIDRHQRYRAVKAKLAIGEVHEVNDLVTLNLNIRQFAQDAIQFSEGPELLRAIWKAIEKVSVLDPTCGSGAFLFAALNILKPLYEACLQRMRGFVEDLEAAGPHHPKKFEDFKSIITESQKHPRQDYFILKAIIVNNLFGVDIMEEAVEICKLRLFLKLVAQVESQDRIEPLPDIDFNIRAGNTLIGYTHYEDVEKAVEAKLDFGSALARIQDRALVLDSAVDVFRKQQTQLDGTVTAEDKMELRGRFSDLENELNDYLSGEYDVKKTGMKKWKETHKPFHWFCDFHRIMSAGGFDVIIGNPPWKEYAAIRQQYRLFGYVTEPCGNLHGMTTERAINLVREGGRVSFIVQLPLTSSSRMNTVRSLLRTSSSYISVIPFDDRPGKLFDGLQHCRSVVFTCRKDDRSPKFEVVSRYQRWPSEARSTLFSTLSFSLGNVEDSITRHFAKLGSPQARNVIEKLQSDTNGSFGLSLSSQKTSDFIFYQEATQYWIKATVGLPFYSKNGQTGAPAHGRYLSFRDSDAAHAANAILNSSLFYLYFIVFGDCFHLSDTLVSNFPTPPSALTDPRLVALNKKLLEDLNRNATTKTITTKDDDSISYAEFSTGPSKPIIDQIDRVMAAHYGLTGDELDFIINYDFKFRLGADVDEA